MPRFNNGMPGRNGGGFGMGNGTGNGMAAGQEKGAGGGRGRRANCRDDGLGFRAAKATGFGQSPVAQRNPGFFRRFCLGLTDQPGTTTNPGLGGILSAIDDLQHQIDALKNSTDK